MVRLQCNKCRNIFEVGFSRIVSVHVGPYHFLKCPGCRRRSWFNFYSSVRKPVTWPVPEREQVNEKLLTGEEEEKKRIEDSRFESDLK